MITILQPVVPSYRLGLFNRLADRLGPEFRVYASKQDMGALTREREITGWERQVGAMRTVMLGLQWQCGALRIPIASCDVVVVGGNPRVLSNVAIILKARLRGAKCLVWGHLWSSTSGPLRAGLRLLLARLAHGLVFYTDEEMEAYRKSVVASSTMPVFALNNGIDTREIVAIRVPYRAEERLDRILFIGRVTSKADLPLLLAALAEPDCAQIGLDIIGSGPQEAEARAIADRLGLRDRVRWHGATTDEILISATANTCKVFVYPGAVGLSLIHGLAYGLPCIVHDDRHGHMPEIAALKPNLNGLTFKRGDPQDLARQISSLLGDTSMLNRMSGAAIATTDATFNAEDMAERFIATIRSIQSGQ